MKELLTPISHPRWLAAEAKLAELNTEASTLRRRADALQAVSDAAPKSHSASCEALELIGDCLEGGHAAALAAGRSAMAELAENLKRMDVVEQAARLLQIRMHTGDGEHCSLIGELSRECCVLAGPVFMLAMRDMQAAVENLRQKMIVADDIASAIELGGGGISDPIRRVYGVVGSVSHQGNSLDVWLDDLQRYLIDIDRAAKSAA